MHIETLSALLHYSDNKDYSEKNQKSKIDLLILILDINQNVLSHGIGILEKYEDKDWEFPMLNKGLKLIRSGMEPENIETILLNIAIINHIDLLTSLLVLEGVLSIQILTSPHVTKEKLLSYFSLELTPYIESLTTSNILKINDICPLSKKEIQELLNSVNTNK